MAVPNRRAAAQRLHSATIHLLRFLRSADAASKVPPAQLSALSVLVFGGPQTLGSLARSESVTSPTMTKIVQGLQAAGLVDRESSKHDRRSTVLRATPAGKRTLLRARDQRVNIFEGILENADASEVRTLCDAAEILERVLIGGRI